MHLLKYKGADQLRGSNPADQRVFTEHKLYNPDCLINQKGQAFRQILWVLDCRRTAQFMLDLVGKPEVRYYATRLIQQHFVFIFMTFKADFHTDAKR